MNGTRQAKPPTRRQLAMAVSQAIPVINAHSQNDEALKQAVDTLKLRVDAAWETIEAHRKDRLAFQSMPFLQRLRWLVRG